MPGSGWQIEPARWGCGCLTWGGDRGRPGGEHGRVGLHLQIPGGARTINSELSQAEKWSGERD